MAHKVTSLAPTVFVFAFALVAFIFSILAMTSKEWAMRRNYGSAAAALSDLDWVNVTYTRYRSPFKICDSTLVNPNDTSLMPLYKMDCTHFKAWGFNKTSCELAIATQSDGASNIGDARLCQQIHYAGNFGIASSTFTGLGFLLTLIMTARSFLRSTADSPPALVEEDHRGNDQTEQKHASSATSKHKTRLQRKQEHLFFAFINLSLVCFLAIAAITALISQFYGVLGLIQSLPNNSDFSSSTGQDVTDLNTHGDHGPWFQGTALSVYMTVAWGFAIAAGFLASMTWRLPQWEMV